MNKRTRIPPVPPTVVTAVQSPLFYAPGLAVVANNVAIGVAVRPLTTPVMISGSMYVEAAEDVKVGDRVVALPGGLLGARVGRGRRAIKRSRWMTTTKKGEVGRIALGMKPKSRRRR